MLFLFKVFLVSFGLKKHCKMLLPAQYALALDAFVQCFPASGMSLELQSPWSIHGENTP